VCGFCVVVIVSSVSCFVVLLRQLIELKVWFFLLLLLLLVSVSVVLLYCWVRVCVCC